MKPLPMPEAIERLLREPNPAVVATIRTDGKPQCVPTWYDYENGRILLNMDHGRVRLRHMRSNPAVSVSILGRENWYQHVSVVGTVEEIYDDAEMRDIDRLSVRYIGVPYRNRERARVSAWVAIDGWFAWDARTFRNDGVAAAMRS